MQWPPSTKKGIFFLRVLKTARSILLDHVTNDPKLRPLMEDDPAMRQTVEVDKKLAVSAFVHETSNYAVSRQKPSLAAVFICVHTSYSRWCLFTLLSQVLDLINFPSSTWLLILLYLTTFSVLVNFCCVGGGIALIESSLRAYDEASLVAWMSPLQLWSTLPQASGLASPPGTLYVFVLAYGVTTFTYTAARHALWIRRFLKYDPDHHKTARPESNAPLAITC